MGAYVTDRSTSPVAAAAVNSNSKTPKTSMNSTGPSISTSKEETSPVSQKDIRPLPRSGHKKGQNVKTKKKTTAILTDTPVKNALKKTTMHALLYLLKFPDRWIGILCLKMNSVGCMLVLLHCVRFDSNFPFQLK